MGLLSYFRKDPDGPTKPPQYKLTVYYPDTPNDMESLLNFLIPANDARQWISTQHPSVSWEYRLRDRECEDLVNHRFSLQGTDRKAVEGAFRKLYIRIGAPEFILNPTALSETVLREHGKCLETRFARAWLGKYVVDA